MHTFSLLLLRSKKEGKLGYRRSQRSLQKFSRGHGSNRSLKVEFLLRFFFSCPQAGVSIIEQ